MSYYVNLNKRYKAILVFNRLINVGLFGQGSEFMFFFIVKKPYPYSQLLVRISVNANDLS